MDDDKAILWLAIEDYAGLWEALWELRSLHPEADTSELTHRARRELGDLVDRGLVALYRCREPYGDVSPVEVHEVDGLLDLAENWLEPEEDAVAIRFSATAAGEESAGVRRST